MGGINRAIIVGRVGRDPEINTMNNGDKVANFSIATSETWRDKNTGERKEQTEWHNIKVFSQNAIGIIEQYVKKGGQVGVEGQIQSRKWKDKDGNDRVTTEIVVGAFQGKVYLLGGGEGGDRDSDRGGRQGSGNGYRDQSGGRDRQGSGQGSSRSTRTDDLSDDIPF